MVFRMKPRGDDVHHCWGMHGWSGNLSFVSSSRNQDRCWGFVCLSVCSLVFVVCLCHPPPPLSFSPIFSNLLFLLFVSPGPHPTPPPTPILPFLPSSLDPALSFLPPRLVCVVSVSCVCWTAGGAKQGSQRGVCTTVGVYSKSSDCPRTNVACLEKINTAVFTDKEEVM